MEIIKKYFKKSLAKEAKRLYNNTMTNLIHKPFSLQPEYRTFSLDCGVNAWSIEGDGYCIGGGSGD